jgi:mannose/cellobiose epimerase-like protein (N-acyl-D-glucosamine 2-epimerase family)
MGVLPGVPGTPSKFTMKKTPSGAVNVYDENGYLIVGTATVEEAKASVAKYAAVEGQSTLPSTMSGGALYWTTKEGKKILLSEMEDSHLMNALFMTERNLKTAQEKMDAFDKEMTEVQNKRIKLRDSMNIYEKNEERLKLEKKRRQNAKMAEKEAMLLAMREAQEKHKVVVVKPEHVGRRFRDDD